VPKTPSPYRWIAAPSHPIRILVLTACFAVLATFAWAQSFVDTSGLLGPVATVTEYGTYDPGSEGPRVMREYAFDANGFETSRTFYNYSFIDGSLRSKSIVSFDGAGLRTLTETTDVDGNVLQRTTYAHDANGNTTQEIVRDADGNDVRASYREYDAAGNLISVTYHEAGALKDTTRCTYDAAVRRTSETKTEANGTVR